MAVCLLGRVMCRWVSMRYACGGRGDKHHRSASQLEVVGHHPKGLLDLKRIQRCDQTAVNLIIDPLVMDHACDWAGKIQGSINPSSLTSS